MASMIKFVFHDGRVSAWYGIEIMFETIILISFYPDIVKTVEFFLDPDDSSTKSLGCDHLDVLDNIFYTSYLSKTKPPAYRETLSRLVLSNIQLNAQDRATFAKTLQHLTELKELDLNIDPGKITRWQLFLFGLQDVKLMKFFKKISKNLGSQKLSKNLTKSLPPIQYLDALIRLPLEKLGLKNLDLRQTTAVCHLLKHLHPKCKTLSLANISFSAQSMKALAQNLQKISISTLDLSSSNCTDEQALELVQLIQQKNPQRKLHIHFGDRYFEGKFAWPLLQLCKEDGISIRMLHSVEQQLSLSTEVILRRADSAANNNTIATPTADPHAIYIRLSMTEILKKEELPTNNTSQRLIFSV